MHPSRNALLRGLDDPTPNPNRHPRRRHLAVAGAVLLAPLCAQEVPEFATLIAQVERAHAPEGPQPPSESFRCDLELRLLDPRAEQRGQVALAVQFLLWRKEGSRKVRPLIRYEVGETEEPVVRGRDRNGPWQLFQGEPRDLTGAEFTADLAACNRHTNLARQMLRCLYPAEVLRSLETPGPVTAGDLRVHSRKPAVPCWVVTGRLAAFPRLQQDGDDAPVELTVFVERASDRLLAAEVRPMMGAEGAIQPDDSLCERIVLFGLSPKQGVQVPHKLLHLLRDEQGDMRPQSEVVLTKIDLHPELRVEDFDRPR